MTDQLAGYCCLSILCVGWPALWAFVAVNLTRHGARGWWRLIVLRLKRWGGAFEEAA